MALVVGVVEQAGDAPQLLVVSAALRRRRAIAASTARQWRRSDSDSTHSLSRDQASSREIASRHGCYPSPALARPLPTAGGRPLMEKFVIEGGVPLSGTVVPAGNKNGALPILAASVLTEDEVVVRNVPRIRDVEAMLRSSSELGVARRMARRQRGRALRRRHRRETPRSTASCPSASAPRSCSPARCWRASAAPTMPPPGGDVIGRRRLDPHLDAFRALGRRASSSTRDIIARRARAGCAPARSSWTSRR